MNNDQRYGLMFGIAYGDALGRPFEFAKPATIAKFPTFSRSFGITSLAHGYVTDDTQMSIAVGRAALTSASPDILTDRIVNQFIRWYNDPKSRDGKRAPGMTCLSAASQLKRNPGNWLAATDTGSKGNGANMRVAPLALRTDWSWDQMGQAAQLQAAVTHGHPVALAASHLTVAAARMLLEGVAKPGPQLLDHLLALAYEQRNNYYGDALGDLWKAARRPRVKQLPLHFPYSGVSRLWEDDPTWPVGAVVRHPAKPVRHRPRPQTPDEYIERGWDKIIDSLLKIYEIPRDIWQDPCDVAGDGWVAEEAIMCALHTLLCFPNNPVDAVRRAAVTAGDSDSIASITGALAGAAYGRSAFPKTWLHNIEYRAELDSLTAKLTNATKAC